MLRPTKHSHPDLTIIAVSARILQHVQKQRSVEYEKLRNFAKKKNNSVDILFLPALHFLYLLGVIEYRQKNDTIEYVGQYETIKNLR